MNQSTRNTTISTISTSNINTKHQQTSRRKSHELLYLDDHRKNNNRKKNFGRTIIGRHTTSIGWRRRRRRRWRWQRGREEERERERVCRISVLAHRESHHQKSEVYAVQVKWSTMKSLSTSEVMVNPNTCWDFGYSGCGSAVQSEKDKHTITVDPIQFNRIELNWIEFTSISTSSIIIRWWRESQVKPSRVKRVKRVKPSQAESSRAELN